MAQIVNCFVCFKESANSNNTHSKIIQIPKLVFQSNDVVHITDYIERYVCHDFDCVLNICVLGYYED